MSEPNDLGEAGQWRLRATGDDDDAVVTRSEEELYITTRRRGTQRARLTKYLETETVTRTVPIRREIARIEYEPIAPRARTHGSLASARRRLASGGWSSIRRRWSCRRDGLLPSGCASPSSRSPNTARSPRNFAGSGSSSGRTPHAPTRDHSRAEARETAAGNDMRHALLSIDQPGRREPHG